jgi:two-component system NarL family sensor kinase
MAQAQVTAPAAGERAGAAGPGGWTSAAAAISALAWLLGAGGLAVAAVSGVLGDLSWPDLAIALSYPAVALLVAHVPEARRWSALTLVSAVFSGANVAATSWADRVYRAHLGPAAGAGWAAWAEGWTWVVSIAGFAAIAIFPDGRLPSRRWRAAPALLVAACAVIVVGNAVRPRITEYGIVSPFPWHRSIQAGVPVALAAVAGLLGCLGAGVAKLRRAGPDRRRQIGWYIFGYGVTAVILVLAVATSLPAPVLAVAPVAVAAGAGIGILRYRLYDLDLVVNRTLVWAALTALSVALYAVCVGFGDRLFASATTLGSLLATGVVAVAFQPLRLRVQRTVNQLIYGYRDQPDVVLREIARTLDPAADADAVLAAAARTLGRSLRLPDVALEIDGGPQFRGRYSAGQPGASQPGASQHGASQHGLAEAAAAQYGGTAVRILVAPRRGTVVSGRDRRLLADLAPSIAVVAESHRLSRVLDTARLRAIATLAEEQRRMRRDLHDGLGPVLAGVRMTISSARRLAGPASAEADQMLADAHGDVQAAMEEVRRLAHDLRPPALDELGLAAALRDRATRILAVGCALDFAASGLDGPLPAAVEVAAYRIAAEAVHNVARHAGATRCSVRLRGSGDELLVEVTDDGTGLGPGSPGIGLRSLRERAEELGGTIEITTSPDAGTVVRARLPVAALPGDMDERHGEPEALLARPVPPPGEPAPDGAA